jgi:hypothetical protein
VIPGYFDTESRPALPFVSAGVRLAGVDAQGEVPFLIDTGSSTTCLHPLAAALQLGIPLADLLNPAAWPRLEPHSGVGGVAMYDVVPAEHVFRTEANRLRVITGAVRIATPTTHNQALPSLLGWDVLEHFRLVVDRRAGRVELHEASPGPLQSDSPSDIAPGGRPPPTPEAG